MPEKSPATDQPKSVFTGEPSRREFIQHTTVAGAALALGVGCGSSSSADRAAEFEALPQGQVTLTRASTPELAVANGLALSGGLGFIKKGDRVLIKPNLTGPIPPPDTTSPAVLVELIRQAWAAGAGEVIVAERVFGPAATDDVYDAPIYEMLTKSYRDYGEAEGARYVSLDDEPWVEVSPPEAVDADGPMLIPSILDEVDCFINAPALKTHNLAVFTMTMKNLFGYIHPDVRNGQVHGHPKNADDPDRPYRMWAQMNLPFNPDFNVMDGIVARNTGGPAGGGLAETNLILMGKDRVAMDAVGLAILRTVGSEPWIMDRPVWEHVQLAEAVRLGIGVGGPDEIEIVSDGIEEIAAIEANLREI